MKEGTVFTGVFLSTFRGGGYPHLADRGIPPSQVQVGYPLPRSRQGVPLPRSRWGYPLPRSRWWYTSFQGPGEGAPFPGPDGGVPLPRSRWGVPPSQVGQGVPLVSRMGYPHLDLGRGYPLVLGRVSSPHPDLGRGYPTPIEVRSKDGGKGGQHSVYLLRGGRYASCVHAGGLSSSRVKSLFIFIQSADYECTNPVDCLVCWIGDRCYAPGFPNLQAGQLEICDPRFPNRWTSIGKSQIVCCSFYFHSNFTQAQGFKKTN